MSWSPELCIGEFRPWPDSVHVTRYKTDETRRYVPEKYSSAMQCLASLENVKLRELVKECHELLQDLLTGYSLDPFTVEVMEQRMRELGIEVDA